MMKDKFLITFLLALVLFNQIKAQSTFFEVYPAPKGVKTSDRYKVKVADDKNKSDSFVYYSTPLDDDSPKAESTRNGVIKGINENEALRNFYFGGKTADLNTEQSVAWTCFSFKGKIQITVENSSEIKSFKILPSNLNLKGTILNNQLSFTLDNPSKLAVVINGDYLNPLFIFGDAPEVAVPSKTAVGTLLIKEGTNFKNIREKVKKASVIYFEPGVHPIGVAFEIFSNQTVYLAGGAYLVGTLHGMMASNVTIRGRGVLAGDGISRAEVLAMKSVNDTKIKVAKRMRYHAINMLSAENETSWNSFADNPGKGCDNLNIEGITIASPRQFFIRATGVPITIHNVKMLGSWPYNTDGVSTIGQGHTTVFDCFFNCNDDAIYVSPNYCNIHHCTFWQGNNGCVFQFHWGSSPVDEQGGYIHDCDIIHSGHVAEANNRMLIGSRKSGPGDLSDVYFRNIRIEGPVWSLFRIETNESGNVGSFKNIHFENISVNGFVLNKSTIKSSKNRKEGETSTSWIKDIYFKNVTINGKKITKDDFDIGTFQVENVVIE
jgi:hypothetical protein